MIQNILITGTSRGLGFELLNIFLEKGWRVFALARNANDFSSVCNQYPNRCIPIEADVTSKKTVEIINRTIINYTNKLDVLINNAGNAKTCFGIENVMPNDLDEHFKVHVSGTFRVVKTCLPFLENALKPIIVNISSRKGSIQRVNSGQYRILLPYQIAKCAQNMLTVGLNQELKDSKVNVYAVHPGNLKTAVAAPDADTDPREGARKIFNWIIADDHKTKDQLYNVMDEIIIEW